MSHLIAKNVRGRVHFRKSCAVCMAQVVIFEINPQRGLDGTGMEFHGVYSLNFAVRQTVHQFQGRNLLPVYICDKGLILRPLCGEARRLFPVAPLQSMVPLTFVFPLKKVF